MEFSLSGIDDFEAAKKMLAAQFGIDGEFALKYSGKIGAIQIQIPIKNGNNGRFQIDNRC